MTISVLVDIGVILVLLISAGVSFFRGAIREVLTIVGVMGGALAALIFGGSLKPLTHGWFGIKDGVDAGKLFDILPMSLVADITAYAMVFIGVFVLLQLASYFLSSSAHAVGLGPIDRTLGVFFGLARGVLLLGLIYLPFYLILPEDNKKEWLSDAKTMFYVEQVSEWMASYLPQDGKDSDVADDARDKLREIDVLGEKRLQPDQKDQISNSSDGYNDRDRDGLDSLLDKIKPSTEKQPQDKKGYNE
ncbi:MAG TPA: CvpA family protein [Alphaproteobacteria bacterium]|nr:CvpA family protein [Alphaproteobacteria bacterium]